MRLVNLRGEDGFWEGFKPQPAGFEVWGVFSFMDILRFLIRSNTSIPVPMTIRKMHGRTNDVCCTNLKIPSFCFPRLHHLHKNVCCTIIQDTSCDDTGIQVGYGPRLGCVTTAIKYIDTSRFAFTRQSLQKIELSFFTLDS